MLSEIYKLLPFIILLNSLLGVFPSFAQPLEIGNRRQLFIDYKFIHNKDNVELRVHKPRKTGEVNIPSDHLWELGGYNSVLEKNGTYHMWYTSSCSPPEEATIAYAYSKDGIHWRRPSLNLTTDENTPKPNNVVIGRGAGEVKGGTHGLMVFIDPNAPESERFRLIANPNEFSGLLQVFSSPDGIHWKHTHRDVVTYNTKDKPHHLDTQNVIFWDYRLEKYVAYIRRNAMEPGNYQGRSVARDEAATIDGFNQAPDMPYVMQGTPKEDIYTNGVIQYPWADDAYFAFPTLYYHYGDWQSEFTDESPTNAGVTDARFAVSRDGITWNNFNWHTFVPPGMDGEFDSKRI